MTDPITTQSASLSERLAMLPKLMSTWVSVLGAAAVAAPVDWANFQFTDLNWNKVFAAAIWLLIWGASRIKSQPNVTP